MVIHLIGFQAASWQIPIPFLGGSAALAGRMSGLSVPLNSILHGPPHHRCWRKGGLENRVIVDAKKVKCQTINIGLTSIAVPTLPQRRLWVPLESANDRAEAKSRKPGSLKPKETLTAWP